MYAKLFPELYTGSMVGAGCVVFAIWPYALANCDAEGYVELNPKLLAMVLGASVQEIEQAIDFLMRPDPDSRSKAEDGCRIVKEGQFLYRLVNYEKYRAIRDKQDRREYQREWDRQNRPSGHKRVGSPTRSDTVRHSPTGPTQAEAEVEEKREKHTRAKFTPPTLSEVAAFAAERGYPGFDSERFIEHYEVADWHDTAGKPVKSWKQRVLTWIRRDEASGKTMKSATHDATDEEAEEYLRMCRRGK